MKSAEPYIIFELGAAAYGLRSADVLHIELHEQVTPVPNTAAPVDGVVFSRGQVVPVLNLRLRFGLPRGEALASARLIFVRVRERTVALLVDAAREFRQLAPEDIRPMSENLHGVDGNYVLGTATVSGRLVLLLDLLAVLNLDDPAPLASAAAAAVPAVNV